MALREKPQRKDFPMGLLGNRQYQRALAQYVGSDKPKPKPASTTKRPNRTERRKGGSSKIDSSKYDMDSQPPKGPNQVKPAKPAAAKPKPKPQPTAAKPKPKPQPATLSAAEKKKRADAAAKKKADAAAMKAELLKIRKAELAAERQKAYKKSMEDAKKNRARGSRPRGPRG